MNAVKLATIDYIMWSPRIEYPAFAGLHVPLLIAAVEDNLRVGNHRYMNPNAVIPMVIKIYVRIKENFVRVSNFSMFSTPFSTIFSQHCIQHCFQHCFQKCFQQRFQMCIKYTLSIFIFFFKFLFFIFMRFVIKGDNC